MLDRRDFIRSAGLAALAAVTARATGGEAPNAARPLRVAMIGSAHSHAAGKWEAVVRRTDLFHPVGIWEPDATLRRQAAAQRTYQGATWLGEAEVFNDSTIEAALVESELPDILPLGRRCLERGWHVQLEKPPGANLAEFTALQDFAAGTARALQVGYMFRYHPAVRFCFASVRQGLVGDVLAIHGDIGKWTGTEQRPWLGEVYGGAMMLLGSHLLDLALGLMGSPQHTTAFRRNSRPPPDRFHDNEQLVLEYPRCLVTLRSLLTEVGGETRRQFVVFGERGTIEILPLEPAQVRLVLRKPAGGFHAGAQVVPLPAPRGRYDDLLADFARKARGGRSELAGFDASHDRLVQRILLQSFPVN